MREAVAAVLFVFVVLSISVGVGAAICLFTDYSNKQTTALELCKKGNQTACEYIYGDK